MPAIPNIPVMPDITNRATTNRATTDTANELLLDYPTYQFLILSSLALKILYLQSAEAEHYHQHQEDYLVYKCQSHTKK